MDRGACWAPVHGINDLASLCLSFLPCKMITYQLLRDVEGWNELVKI